MSITIKLPSIRALILSTAVATTLAFSNHAHALVDMRNANYSETWVDIDVKGGTLPLRVQRAYNSRSLYNGIFGFGWCSDLETRLEVTAEGNIKILECGDGAESVYRPRDFSKADVEDTVSKILAAHRQANPQLLKAALDKLKAEITLDRGAREELAEKYKIVGRMAEGRRYFANGRENESIVREKNWYTRELPDGTSQRFDLLGRLTAYIDRAGGTALRYNYTKDLMTEIVDSRGRKLSFSYHPFKKVRRIDGPDRQFATYEYAGLKTLAQARAFDGAVYKYKYDDLYNLTEIALPDKTTIKLTYDKNKDWVTSFTDRYGCTEKYEWILSKEDPKNNYASTLVKTCEGKVVVRSRFEFWFKPRADGDGKYLARTLVKNNNDEVDTTFHPQFGKPTVIKRGGVTINYEYLPNGLVGTRTQGSEVTRFRYDDKTKKVIEVRTSIRGVASKDGAAASRVYNFKYDDKGNLMSAQNSDGLSVQLTYDENGRIATISDQARRNVRIQYENRFGKPRRVEIVGVGALDVTYKPDGSVKEASSGKGGPTVAVQVASTFNSLLDLVAPAGVDLGI